jgi:AraC family transcriptional regulator
MKAIELSHQARVRKAVDFIDSNLKEDLPLEAISARACVSHYHFHRLFHAFMGRSLAEYLRVRRLYAAACELAETKASVLEIALEYRYSGPESFQRAFKAHFGLTPRTFRKRGKRPTARSAVGGEAKATGQERGGRPMEATIVAQESFRAFGRGIRTRSGSCHADVGGIWAAHSREEPAPGPGSGPAERSMYGICYGACAGFSSGGAASPEGTFFQYFVGYRAPADGPAPEGYSEATVPGGLYAVFGSRVDRIQETLDAIYSEWLPRSGYELAERPLLERYGPDWRDSEGAGMELLLPIREERS